MNKVFMRKRLSTVETLAPLLLTWLASCRVIFTPGFSFYSALLASVVLMMTWSIARVVRHSPYGSVPGLRIGTIIFAVMLAALLCLYPHEGVRVVFIELMPSVLMIFIWMLVVGLYCFWPSLMADEHQGLFVYVLLVLAGLIAVDCVWSTGYAAAALQHPAPERFPCTFEIWDRLPFSAHGFLTFDARGQLFETKRAYVGYSQLFPFVHYLAFKIFRAFSGISYARGIRLTPFLYGIVFSFLFPLFSLMWTSAKQRKSFRVVLILVTAMVIFICIPDMWIALGWRDADNEYPLTALFHIGIVSLLWGCWRIPVRWIILWSLLYACMAPIGACLSAVVIVLCAFAGNRELKNLAVPAILFVLFGMGSYFSPVLVGKLTGFSASGSPWIWRSGLDGSDQYFKHIFQAVFKPQMQFELRPYGMFWIAWGLLAMLFWSTKRYMDNLGIGFTAVCALTGFYFINAILFPQSASIHPYLYDIMFIMPVVACIPVVLSLDILDKPRIKVMLPLFFMGALWLVQHNFTMIARFVAKHFFS